MAAIILQLADAVTTALNAATLSQSFAAVRSYIPVYGKQDEDADDLSTLTVAVVPSELAFTTEARNSDEFDYIIDIGIFKRVEPTNDVCDPLMQLVEEIADLFRGDTVTASLPARFVSATNAPIYDQEMMRQQNIFAALIRLFFKKSRDKV